MKNLLTIAFIVTFLSACGGGFTQQDKVSVEKAPTTEQNTVEHAVLENKELTSETDTDTAEQDTAKSKSDSAIRMFQGIAKSMY